MQGLSRRRVRPPYLWRRGCAGILLQPSEEEWEPQNEPRRPEFRLTRSGKSAVWGRPRFRSRAWRGTECAQRGQHCLHRERRGRCAYCSHQGQSRGSGHHLTQDVRSHNCTAKPPPPLSPPCLPRQRGRSHGARGSWGYPPPRPRPPREQRTGLRSPCVRSWWRSRAAGTPPIGLAAISADRAPGLPLKAHHIADPTWRPHGTRRLRLSPPQNAPAPENRYRIGHPALAPLPHRALTVWIAAQSASLMFLTFSAHNPLRYVLPLDSRTHRPNRTASPTMLTSAPTCQGDAGEVSEYFSVRSYVPVLDYAEIEARKLSGIKCS